MRTRWLSSLTLAKPCWICLIVVPEAVTPQLDAELKALGFSLLPDCIHGYALCSHEDWNSPWPQIVDCLKRHGREEDTHVGLLGGEDAPTLQEAELHQKSVAETQELSEQLWLLEAIAQNRLTCHFQPVIDRKGEVYGYESLVRAAYADGQTANGGAIFNASRLLRIEHLIDRHLHELAIRHYHEQKLGGYLFINLVPGFIQRPEFYFGGLAEAVQRHGISPRNIVLDCSNSENPRDMQHLKAIVDYCRKQGYLVALDDIESVQSAKRCLHEMQPDFIKLDMILVRKAEQQDAMETIHELVDITRNSACTLIAEGVETPAIHELLLQAGIGLFQGYLFSPPAAKARGARRI